MSGYTWMLVGIFWAVLRNGQEPGATQYMMTYAALFFMLAGVLEVVFP